MRGQPSFRGHSPPWVCGRAIEGWDFWRILQQPGGRVSRWFRGLGGGDEGCLASKDVIAIKNGIPRESRQVAGVQNGKCASASAGIAFYPEDAETAETLLSAADASMSVAKSTRVGRSRATKAVGQDKLMETARATDCAPGSYPQGSTGYHGFRAAAPRSCRAPVEAGDPARERRFLFLEW